VANRQAAITSRRFPPPWTVEEIEACFIVRDANRQALAYVYFEEEPGRRSAAHLLTCDEARRIAANIAKLVEAVLTSALYPAPFGRHTTYSNDTGKPIALCPAYDDRAHAHSCIKAFRAYRRRFQRRVASSKCLAWDLPSQRTLR
jgi:hypothetical protein